ncbi:GlxA family transcriptional regulator [Amycolatopsis nigrescens]|uniref:GlxA family transcriptional regulator n=1 Tax=Amycolatopsis nigrescens TaxID=381445 RepID=UPI000362AD56|nr:helix-turn-helix domain-containing protein [Amycolatopsis nigrescens]
MRKVVRKVVIVGYQEADLLEIACLAEVLDAANGIGANPAYQTVLASQDGHPMRCGSGLTLADPHRLDRVRGPLDTIIVVGGIGHLRADTDTRLLSQVRRLAATSRRIASVCSGATVLAAAGLLDGKCATTHWTYASAFARRFPRVKVDPAPLFIQDGNVYTSGGVTSSLDLALALVEQDHGPSLAREVARNLVTYLQRPGNQAQISMFLAAPAPEHRVVADLAGHIAGNLDADLSTPALAAMAGTSTRHLTRLFGTHLGDTPSRYVRAVRTEAAAQLLSSTELPLTAIARRCGFGSTETLRQAFLDHYDTSPSALRRTHQRHARR